MYKEPNLNQTNCKLQPNQTSCKASRLFGVSLFSSLVKPASVCSFPSGKAPYSLLHFPRVSAGMIHKIESFSCLQLQGLTFPGWPWGTFLSAEQGHLPEAGAAQLACWTLSLHSSHHFVSLGRVERVVCYHCFLCHCCCPGNPVLDCDLLL